MVAGAGCFNRTASKAYSALSAREKEDLEKQCVKKDQTLSRREIKKAGKKIFEKIEKQVPQLRSYIRGIVLHNTILPY